MATTSGDVATHTFRKKDWSPAPSPPPEPAASDDAGGGDGGGVSRKWAISPEELRRMRMEAAMGASTHLRRIGCGRETRESRGGARGGEATVRVRGGGSP